MKWEVVFAKPGGEGRKKAFRRWLEEQGQALIEVLTSGPFQNPPLYEKLVGDLEGAYSRRMNIHHRLVYEVFNKERKVRVLRMWTHYE